MVEEMTWNRCIARSTKDFTISPQEADVRLDRTIPHALSRSLYYTLPLWRGWATRLRPEGTFHCGMHTHAAHSSPLNDSDCAPLLITNFSLMWAKVTPNTFHRQTTEWAQSTAELPDV
jgi:hypothetical protein